MKVEFKLKDLETNETLETKNFEDSTNENTNELLDCSIQYAKDCGLKLINGRWVNFEMNFIGEMRVKK